MLSEREKEEIRNLSLAVDEAEGKGFKVVTLRLAILKSLFGPLKRYQETSHENKLLKEEVRRLNGIIDNKEEVKAVKKEWHKTKMLLKYYQKRYGQGDTKYK